MPEPVVTTGAVALGAGAWFANKILGPSAGRLGDNLLVYSENRVPKIFGRADAIAHESNIEPKPIKPGLLTRMVIDASMSEDAEEITEWWANLFVDASQASCNQHALFSDIMAQIGPKEVKLLDEFLQLYDSVWSTNAGKNIRKSQNSPELAFNGVCQMAFVGVPIDENRRDDLNSLLAQKIPTWPIKNFSWIIPSVAHRAGSPQGFTLSWYVDNLTELSILERAGIFRRLQAERTIKADYFARVEALALTPIGLEFYSACTGKWKK